MYKISKDQLGHLLDAIPSLITVTSIPDEKILYANDFWCRETGYSREEVVGRPSSGLFFFKDPSQQKRLNDNLAKNKLVVNQEISFLSKDGMQRDFNVSLIPIEVDGLPCVLSSLQDLTAFKQTYAEFTREQALLKALVNSSNDMIWSVNHESFGLLTWNRAFEDYFNRDRGLPIKVGDRPEDLFPKGSPYVQTWKEFFQRAKKESFSINYPTFSNTRILRINFNRIHQEDRLVGISVFGQDITNEFRSQQELVESEKRFRILTEHALTGIYINQNGKFSYVNPAMAKMMGYEPAEMIGAEILRFIHPDDRAQSSEIMRRNLAGETESRHYEIRALRKNGDVIYLEIMGTRIRIDNQPAMMGTILDITERRQAELALRERIKELDALFTLTELSRRDGIGLDDLCREAVEILPSGWQYPDIAYAQLSIHDKEFRTRNFKESKWRLSTPINIHGSTVGRIEVGYLEERPAADEGPFLKNERLVLDVFADRLGQFVAQKSADEALKRSEEKFRQLTEKTFVGIYIIQDSKMAYVNPSFAAIFGYSPEEITGKLSPRELIHPEDLPLVMKRLQERLGGQTEKTSIAYRGVKKDGAIIFIEVYGMKIEHQGRPAVMGTLIDVTERLRAQNELKESENRYRTIVETTAEGIWSLDKDHLTVFVNERMASMLGYRVEEMLGRPGEDFMFEEDLPAHRKEMANRRKGIGGSYERRFRTKQGQTVWMIVSATALKNDGGGYEGSYAMFTDITQRKQAEEALRERESDLLEAQKIADLGSFSLDFSAGLFRTSKVMDEILGIDENYNHTILGWSALIHPDDRVRTMDYLENEVIGRRQPADVEYRIVRFHDNQIRWIHSLGKITYGVDGQPAAVHGTSQDITGRRRAEETIRESEALFRTSFESSIAGISLVAEDGKFMRVNNQLSKILGYSHEELAQKRYNDITYPEDKDIGVAILEQMISGKRENATFEKRYIRKDGEVIWVFLSVSAIRDKQNKFQYFVTYTQDITERKAAEGKLRNTVVGTVNTIALIVEARDPYTSGHQKRVADISVAIAQDLGLPDDAIQGIFFASLIHDLGKIQVPSEILSKPGLLTDLEFEMIKTHPKVGYELLKSIDFPWPIAEIVYQHHERLDGSGYPRKLKGEDVLVEAKIIGVADVVEAISSHRPYRPALGMDKALEEIKSKKGVLYDAKVVDSCVKVMKQMEIIPSGQNKR